MITGERRETVRASTPLLERGSRQELGRALRGGKEYEDGYYMGAVCVLRG